MKRVIIGLLVVALLLLPGCFTQEDLDNAYDEGYAQGFFDGEADYWAGYDKGYDEGYSDGENWGHDQGYQIGFWSGYDEGYEEGENKGESSGYERGYQVGFWAGEDEASGAYSTIAQDSYDQGYIEGLRDCSPNGENGVFVGSVNSDVYHYPWCVWANKILLQNEIWFDSVEEARDAGYRPCKVCNPP